MAVTAKVRVFDEAELQALKQALTQQLEVHKHVRKLTCIACTHHKGRDVTQTFEGRAEYVKTGICERCWDALTQGLANRNTSNCNKLTPRGAALLRLSIMVHKARLRIAMSDAPARVCEQIISNSFDCGTLYKHASKPRRGNQQQSSSNANPATQVRRARSTGPRTPH